MFRVVQPFHTHTRRFRDVGAEIAASDLTADEAETHLRLGNIEAAPDAAPEAAAPEPAEQQASE